MSATKITPEAGRAALAEAGTDVAVLFRHGTLAVDFFAPRGEDHLMPHARDGVYVVISGSGTFVSDGEPQPVGPGEVVFVAAGTAHHFVDVSDDFATWALFHGPAGGEGG
ncbi:MAG TPA: cupin domain-containing protein [Rubricoccaceae bacterium]|jgi:mannose-6-phosphate isomerase-like protein (cupin superfamily)